MIELIKKFRCDIDPEDYVEFDASEGSVSVDVFNSIIGDTGNSVVILNKKKVTELIEFLQNHVDSLKD